MKKTLILSTFIMLFMISCSNSEAEKKVFMEACDDGTLGSAQTSYCECAWGEYETHGNNEAYLTAIQDNCLGILMP